MIRTSPLAALMQHVPGPDFPTAGIINGAQEIATAYRTGRGRLSVRARVQIEDVGKGDRQAIIVTELPFQVNKARLIERIARAGAREADRRHRRDGLRDESDKDGMRVVIELKRGEVAGDRAQQPLRADADGDGVRHQHGRAAGRAAEADVAEGDAGCLHPASARDRHPAHDLRSRARRASVPTSSKASPSRWPTSTRSSRSSRPRRRRPRRATALLARAWSAGHRAAAAGARGRDLHAAERPRAPSSA